MKFIAILIFLTHSFNSYGQPQITPQDLSMLVGSWEGSLTYLDYQSNKPYTMPANLEVEQGKNENKLVLRNIYPDEPKANSSDKIKITKNGTLFNKHTVTARQELENGHIQVQTEHEAKDDNKKALIRYTYVLGSDFFSIMKEVQFAEGAGWIKRSESTYTRKK